MKIDFFINDERFERAVHNISKLLEEGGCFLYSDCLTPKEKKRQGHIVFRKEETTLQIMKKHGLIPVAMRPVFYMMDAPVVTDFRYVFEGFGGGSLAGSPARR
jgi:hypothetical protein